MARTKAKRKPKPLVRRDDVTPERAARNDIASAGMAYRIVPVIDTLRAMGRAEEAGNVPPAQRRGISQTEWEALAYYRDQASLADRSPVRSCCDMSPRGGNGPGVAILSAMIETGRLERDMGVLADIARAVAVEDRSLTEWCIARHGGREKSTNGKVVAIVPRGLDDGKGHIAMARMELRMAAQRIAR